MNDFFRELLMPIVYKWVSYIDQKKECFEDLSFNFSNENVDAYVRFYEDNVLELEILKKNSDEQLFYLHFEMVDFKTTIENIQDFLSCLNVKEEKNNDIIEIKNQAYRILLSCSAGLTTSYFAYMMQEKLDEYTDKIEVNAINYERIDEVAADYDLILLAPQIHYAFHPLREKYGAKVMKIKAKDYASCNVTGVIQEVMALQH